MLKSYLLKCANEPFRWGERDCALFVADWVRIVTGIDPASHLRGKYSSRDGAMVIAGRGGLFGVVARCARSAGLRRVQRHGVGSIGIVRDRDRVAYCAIMSETGWAARTESGLIVANPRSLSVIAAWEAG